MTQTKKTGISDLNAFYEKIKTISELGVDIRVMTSLESELSASDYEFHEKVILKNALEHHFVLSKRLSERWRYLSENQQLR